MMKQIYGQLCEKRLKSTGGSGCTRFRYPLFYFSIVRSINILSVAKF
jgi:hypothetical protein